MCVGVFFGVLGGWLPGLGCCGVLGFAVEVGAAAVFPFWLGCAVV